MLKSNLLLLSCFEGSTIILKRKFSASQFWDDCRKYSVTVIQYIGEVMRYLCSTPGVKMFLFFLLLSAYHAMLSSVLLNLKLSSITIFWYCSCTNNVCFADFPFSLV